MLYCLKKTKMREGSWRKIVRNFTDPGDAVVKRGHPAAYLFSERVTIQFSSAAFERPFQDRKVGCYGIVQVCGDTFLLLFLRFDSDRKRFSLSLVLQVPKHKLVKLNFPL